MIVVAAPLILLLAAGSLRAEEPLPKLPEWAAELGLSQDDGGWAWRQNDAKPRRLSGDEAARLARLLSNVDSADAPSFAQFVAHSVPDAKAKGWFEGSGSEPKLTVSGKKALPGLLLDTSILPEAPPAPAQLPSPGVKPGGAAPFAVLAFAPAFDDADKLGPIPDAAPKPGIRAALVPPPGSGKAPLEIYAGWGVPPNDISRGRDIQSAYALVAWAGDRGASAIAGDSAAGGVAARSVKSVVVDIPVGLMGSFWEHELGHFDWAVMAGAKDVTWSHSGKSNVFGFLGETDISAADAKRMTPAQLMAFNAAGIHSTQSSAEDMRNRFTTGDPVPWHRLPLWAFEKMDSSIYGLFVTPPPGKHDQTAWDTVDWRDRYAERSGRPVKAVHNEIVAGAVWNMLDPGMAWAAASYFGSYVAKGRQTVDPPLVKVGDVKVGAGTGFWLGETGPQYRLSVTVVEPKSKTVVGIAPTAGESGQGGVESRVEVQPKPYLRVRATGSVWEQRAAAEPGPVKPGGGGTVGVDLSVLNLFTITADAGGKSRGDQLGRRFEATPIFEAGASGKF
jgi:hypothetical protein